MDITRISTTGNPIYKIYFNLKFLKKQIYSSPLTGKMRIKSLQSFLKGYSKALDEAKNYKEKAKDTERTKYDDFKSSASMAWTGGTYTSPKRYSTKEEWNAVIKELTECKKFIESELENELKKCETFLYDTDDINTYIESLFDFDLL